MRVDVECCCGARIGVGYEASSPYRSRPEQEAAERLLEQFRRDHKTCRINAAAVAATKGAS
jgi:hypothetical protein